MANPISDDQFDSEVLQSDIPVLVDFWAPWCGPCKAMLPVVEELSNEYAGRVKIVKINVDENSEAPGQYQVMSIPTFILFNGGEIVTKFVGVKAKEDIAAELDAVLE